jgi:hypothetical protein
MFSMVAEQECIFRIDVDESWQRGAAGSRRWSRVDGFAQEGDAVWRRGGVIGKFGEVYTDLNLEDCSEVRWRR